MSDLVSVIIPCYNQGRFLAEAIESVLAQRYSDIEVLVVDDGATDDTVEVASRYRHVRLIRQANAGLAAARNRGITESRGRYLVFLDADDRLLPDALEAGVESLAQHPACAFVAGHYRLVAADGSLLHVPPQQHVATAHYAELLRRNYIAMHAAVMYRRSALEAVTAFDASLAASEDYDLYLRIARRSPIYCHSRLVADYRQHDRSLTRDPALMLEYSIKALRGQWRFVRGNATHEAAYRAGMRYWRGYYGAQLSGQRDTRATLEVVDASISVTPDRLLWGCRLEAPHAHTQRSGHFVEVVGWVVGRDVPAVEIEIAVDGRTTSRVPVDGTRPDVAAHYPSATGSRTSGFHTWVALPGMGEKVLHIAAVLRDQRRASLACIRTRRRWRNNDGAPTPLVSVVIPCHNQARFLADAVDSVVEQTYPHFEVLVVDDGSTDNTEAVAAQYPGVRCIRQPNQGLSSARNRGLHESLGEFVVFLDADDRLLPRALEVGIEALAARPDCGFTWGHFERIAADGARTTEPRPPQVNGPVYDALLRRNVIAVPATVMYRRTVFSDTAPFDPRATACEDYDLYLRLARITATYYHGHVIAQYRQHGGNMTRNAARMLRAALAIQRSQWPIARTNARHRKSYRIGRATWRDNYGEQLVNAARASLQRGKGADFGKMLLPLLRHYPRGLVSLLRGYDEPSRVRDIVRATLPRNATVIVFGQDAPTRLRSRAMRAWSFAGDDGGMTCSPYPSASGDAIRQLESLRARGAGFLLMASGSFWWLAQHPEFETHMETHHRRVWSDERCVIFALSETEREHFS